MSTSAEIMRAYKLLTLERAAEILGDENRQWTAAEAQFWLVWAQAELDPDYDWTLCLIKKQIALVCSCDRFDQAKNAVSEFLADKSPKLSQSEIDMIIDAVSEELDIQKENLEVAFSWDGNRIPHCTVLWSHESGGAVVQLPDNLRDPPIFITKL